MALISEQLPNLMNGVSQQAVTMRMPSQAEEQVNGLSSVVYGNIKRPPSQMITKLAHMTDSILPYWHTINRDTSERYFVEIRQNSIKVYDATDGTEKTVNAPDGTAYLNTAVAPTDAFRAITVADYTFIVNTQQVVGKLADLTPANAAVGLDVLKHNAILFVKGVNYDTEYTIKIDGVDFVSYTTPKTSDNPNTISTTEVTRQLVDALQASGWNANWTAYDASPIIQVTNYVTPFSMEIADSRANSLSVTMQGQIQNFTDLPLSCRHDYIVEVTGDGSAAFDNYYLKFVCDVPAHGWGNGYWEETVAPGIEHKLDPATMPHILVRESDGTFTFKQAEWDPRVAGDIDSVPWPSFVGRTINDLYFDRRRLCFLSDDNVIMSHTGEFFNFFPKTVLQVLDDGPIDVSAAGNKVSILKYATPYNKSVILFADQTQFLITDETLRASAPPSLKPIPAYTLNSSVRPEVAGDVLLYTTQRGDYDGVMEYYISTETADTDAANVTEHVPKFIPAGCFTMATSSSVDAMILGTEGNKQRLYVYKYHWNNNEKLQSSWSYWTLPEGAEVQYLSFINEELFLLVRYTESEIAGDDGLYLEKISFSQASADAGEDIIYHLDRRVDDTQVRDLTYDVNTDTTTFRLPYLVMDGSDIKVVTRKGDGTSSLPASKLAPITSTNNVTFTTLTDGGTEVTVRGDYRTVKFFVGITYAHRYTFSEPVLKTRSATGGTASVIQGRLQILRYIIAFSETGFFRVEVKLRNRQPTSFEPVYSYERTSVNLGSEDAVIDDMKVGDGVAKIPIRARAGNFTLSLINDSFMPSAFTAAEWEGNYHRVTSRI